MKNLATTSPITWDSSYIDGFINQILGSGNETIRGFNLGDSIAKVKELEDIEQFEETKGTLGYTFETSDFELVDVFYKHDSANILTGVQLDIYLNSDTSSQDMNVALVTHFTQKYGKPIVDIGLPTWKLNETDVVSIKSIASKMDHGLQINFAKK